MTAGDWRGVFTIIMLVLFVAIVRWAWSKKRKKTFEEAARLPLDSDDKE